MNFSNDIKYQLQHGNTLMKLLLVNVLLFLVQSLVLLIAFFGGFKSEYISFLANWLWASSDINTLVTRPWTIVTYMFLHSPESIFHILSNMLYLYFFGRIFVDFFNHKKAYPLYLTGGLVGFLASLLAYNLIPSLNNEIGVTLVGASAAVMAIVLATATLAPDFTVYLLIVGPVKLKYIALFVVIIDLISIPSTQNLGGHIAHLGGALIGYLYIRSYKNGKDWFYWWPRFEEKVYGLFEKRKPKVVYRNQHNPEPASKRENDINKQQKLDAILDKIKIGGYESLSKGEKEFLFKISNEK